MSVVIQKDKVSLDKVTHSVRASQAVLQYGVGAMVDFPDQTLMTAAPEYWAERIEKIHDERLERILHVNFLGMPCNSSGDRFGEGISYVRFPQWYFCPKCRRFQPLSAWISDYKQFGRQKDLEKDPYMVKHMRCPTCHQDLVVTRIITVCENGHIDDFPWVKWVHSQNIGGNKHICKNPKLLFKTGASSVEGLEGLEIICETCNAKATLRGAFDPDRFRTIDEKYPGEYDYKCSGNHPWKHLHEKCDLYPRVLQRGSSSVYFPVVFSSLVIPPYSNILTTKIESSSAYGDLTTTISNTLSMLPLEQRQLFVQQLIMSFSTKIATEISAGVDDVKSVLERKWQSQEPDEQIGTSSIHYRAEEYDALNGSVKVSADEYGDFIREATDINNYGLPFLKSVSLIHKIREVQALIGFTRIKPAEKDAATVNGQTNRVVCIKEPETNWYPAYQVRGEGIFIEFDEAYIRKWQANHPEVNHRVSILNEKYKESFIGSNNPRTISAKFLLLHTISHLLIKQLSFECGYNIASIKERIYCSDSTDGKEMSGILIYTASGDSEGTMGGLVRQGRPDIFSSLFKKAIETAVTCSNDPVCSLSLGQGRDSLNLSACYSCALIPETSCEEFNVFLDRGVVIGTFNNRNMGFFSSWLNSDPVQKQNQSEPAVAEADKTYTKIIIPKEGTDMTDVPYSEIWKGLKQWADRQQEKELFDALIDKSSLFDGKEKPLQDGSFVVAGDTNQYSCDLMWIKSKVMLFTDENAMEYETAHNSNWQCFISGDEALTPEILANAIRRI